MHLHHGSMGELYESIELSPVRNAQGEVTHFVEKLEEIPIAKSLAHAVGLVGRSPAFQKMLELVARVAPSDAAVLLQGESGTGKELVAQAIHDASRRSRAPFVVLDCSGLPEALFESELFGHERGAFTGAATRREGLVNAASGGTLFLDEVGDIPYSMQVKLLRLLETGTYRRVGSTELLKSDFRLISATHRSMARLAAEGKFRQDLYFRLNTFPIALPALRERREDIPLLAEALLARVSSRVLAISAGAMELLVAYSYPGNIRELRNLLERASLLCDGKEVRPGHLAEEVRAGAAQDIDAGAAAIRPVRPVELAALSMKCAGRWSEAAHAKNSPASWGSASARFTAGSRKRNRPERANGPPVIQLVHVAEVPVIALARSNPGFAHAVLDRHGAYGASRWRKIASFTLAAAPTELSRPRLQIHAGAAPIPWHKGGKLRSSSTKCDSAAKESPQHPRWS